MVCPAMFSLSPRTTLLLLLSLAAVVLVGGVRLARQEESVRLDRDRSALQRFAGDAQAELQKLDTLYTDHLTTLARRCGPEQTFELRRAADRIVGIQQVSFLHRGGGDAHVQVYGERLPVPALQAPRSGLPIAPVLVSEEKLFDDAGDDSGWIDEPGKPLFYWLRRSSKEVAVLLIQRADVEAAISRWLESWSAQAFEPVRVERGPDQLRPRGGRALVVAGDSLTTAPDLLLPLRSRFGNWELASWDRRTTHVHHHASTLLASGAVAVLLALSGVLIALQQRRALALAAQRVSFVNRVSHELRTPLTNILLNLDLATDSLADETPAPSDATRRLALVREEARRLGRLIDNVLTFSKHDQGKLRHEPRACVPASVIAAVVEQFAPSFARRALEVRCTGELSAPRLLDADAFAQILANLLSNVEKYVPGGIVEIAGTLDADTLAIVVRDQGPGIPADAAERIFRPFERLDSRVNEGTSGTGLGLAIALDLAATMGGTLRLVPGERGASFELRVPAPPAAPLTAVSAA
jgi:signal transduction histidine kinase